MSERLLLDITRVEITDDAFASGIGPSSTRLVPLLDIVGPPVGFPNRPDRDTLRAIRRDIARQATWPGAVVGIVSTALAIPVAATIMPVIANGDWRRLWITAASLVLLLVVYDRLILPIFRNPYRKIYVGACLTRGLCPFCLYQLPERVEQPGVRCSECGGVWLRRSASV